MGKIAQPSRFIQLHVLHVRTEVKLDEVAIQPGEGGGVEHVGAADGLHLVLRPVYYLQVFGADVFA